MAAMTAAASSSSLVTKQNPILSSSSYSQPFNQNLRISNTNFIKSPINLSLSSLSSSSSSRIVPVSASTTDSSDASFTAATAFHGVCYVLGENIDTDQIIPAEYLTLVPSKPEEYKKLGSFALIGLPSDQYPIKFVESGEFKSKYSIIIAGDNFGCGSSREHAPVALGAAGVTAVVAESYARIFFRNSVATGEVYPLESETRLCDECTTGDVITIELGESLLINHTTKKEYKLKPIGDAGPVIEAGGIFAYARKAGMIPTLAPSS
ncbi:3-isopropylmalate dehydratase small subunit 3-like [Papaver somniferum]|uniref:3-isopropylmalate dehydratase small subunit 3-like n=1 Tax=Papaver somniferum TaxID=3469 RepID=UPI000E6F8E46|nr:3-isopropylmalate dehydratase small subunit 3-like [Papaver somniferum]